RSPQGRRAHHRAARRDHGREAHGGAHSAVSSAAALARRGDARRRRRSRRDHRGRGDHCADRRGDGGTDCCNRRGAHRVRHMQGDRQGDDDRRGAPAREDEGAGMKVAVLTVSDRVSRGEAEDGSGDLLESLLREDGFDVERKLVPDERPQISAALRELAERAQIVLTTGGTGLAPRDVTPEATQDVLEREAPGIAQAIRVESLHKTPYALLSRGVAGLVGSTLIVNLPGSPGGCRDGYDVLRPVLPHVLELLGGTVHVTHKPSD